MAHLYSMIVFDTPECNRAFKQEWTSEIDKKFCTERWLPLLYHAVLYFNIEIVQFLLEKGVNPNQLSDTDLTPIMAGWRHPPSYARMLCRLLLLKHGGNPYYTTDDGDGAFLRANVNGAPSDYLESYLVVDLVCGKADDLPLDIWRVVKPFIYNI